MFRSVPMVRCYPVRAVPLAAVIPSRVPAVAGGMGRVRVRADGQAGSIKRAPAPVTAGQTD